MGYLYYIRKACYKVLKSGNTWEVKDHYFRATVGDFGNPNSLVLLERYNEARNNWSVYIKLYVDRFRQFLADNRVEVISEDAINTMIMLKELER
jgi:hypothetical protein